MSQNDKWQNTTTITANNNKQCTLFNKTFFRVSANFIEYIINKCHFIYSKTDDIYVGN